MLGWILEVGDLLKKRLLFFMLILAKFFRERVPFKRLLNFHILWGFFFDELHEGWTSLYAKAFKALCFMRMWMDETHVFCMMLYFQTQITHLENMTKRCFSSYFWICMYFGWKSFIIQLNNILKWHIGKKRCFTLPYLVSWAHFFKWFLFLEYTLCFHYLYWVHWPKL